MDSKRPAESTSAAPEAATPAKRARTDEPATGGAGVDPSSPAVRDTDSPSIRGNRGGKARGGRGGESRGGGRSGGRGGRGGGDSRSWGGRSDNAKGGMRSWGKKDGEEGAADWADGEDGERKERLPKKKMAVLFGYNGIGYSGSQINPEVQTIEGVLFKAFVESGAVSADNSADPHKVGLSRAARTDAGVHAGVNVISLKLILSPPNLPADMPVLDWINTFLPPTIRLWSFIRVQGSFNPRNLCDQRHYEYSIPTHMFLAPKPGTAMAERIKAARASSTEGDAAPAVEGAAATAIAESAVFWAAQPEETVFADDLIAKRAYRISPAVLQLTREFIEGYQGSHNYYNYTIGKDFRDRTSQRVMRKLTVSDPFIVDGNEFVAVSFVGQSFMLHQIRKMIGLLMLAVRTSTPPSLIPETFGPSRIHIPKAPALGLLLLEPQYEEYNKKVHESNKKLDLLDEAGKVTVEEMAEQRRDPVEIGNQKELVDAFKREEIYKRMWEVEAKDNTFSLWVNFLDVYVGTDFEYLNPKGIIPAVAVFKKGENTGKSRREEGAVEAGPESDDEKAVAGEDG